MEKKNYYEYYASKDSPDLAEEIYSLLKYTGGYGDMAVSRGETQGMIDFMYDIDWIMYLYCRMLTGFLHDNYVFDVRIRMTFNEKRNAASVLVLYSVIYVLYARLIEKELYELIPAMAKINSKLSNTLRGIYPDANEQYFQFGDMDYFKHLLANESKRLGIINN